jgi:hypothetical protein
VGIPHFTALQCCVIFSAFPANGHTIFDRGRGPEADVTRQTIDRQGCRHAFAYRFTRRFEARLPQRFRAMMKLGGDIELLAPGSLPNVAR